MDNFKAGCVGFVFSVVAIAGILAIPVHSADSKSIEYRLGELERKVAGMQQQITLLHAKKLDKVMMENIWPNILTQPIVCSTYVLTTDNDRIMNTDFDVSIPAPNIIEFINRE